MTATGQRLRPEPSVAVLPFRDLSREQDQEYFCLGLAEEVILALTRVPGVRVASRSAVARLSTEDPDPAEIGRRLGAGVVLDGSVRKEGDRLRVAAQLVDAQDGYCLWSERFDRRLEDVFAIQDDITRRIVETFRLTVVRGTSAVGVEPGTARVEAYNAYLKGRYHCGKRTEAGLVRAIEHFREALDEEPDYARAYAGLADAFSLLGIYGLRPPREVMPQGRQAAARALNLDRSLAEAHASLGCIQAIYEWDFAASRASFERALGLDPESAAVRQGYAMHCLAPTGRFEEAVGELERAHQLDPLSPVILTSIGVAHYYERRYEAATAALARALELDGRFGVARYFLGRAQVEIGASEEAIGELERAIELAGPSPERTAALAYARAVAGEADVARELHTTLEARAREGYVSPVLLAQVRIALGETEAALEALEAAFGDRSVELVWLDHHPAFDTLRQLPRFDALRRRIGLDRTTTAIERRDLDRDTLAEPLPRDGSGGAEG